MNEETTQLSEILDEVRNLRLDNMVNVPKELRPPAGHLTDQVMNTGRGGSFWMLMLRVYWYENGFEACIRVNDQQVWTRRFYYTE